MCMYTTSTSVHIFILHDSIMGQKQILRLSVVEEMIWRTKGGPPPTHTHTHTHTYISDIFSLAFFFFSLSLA